MTIGWWFDASTAGMGFVPRRWLRRYWDSDRCVRECCYGRHRRKGRLPHWILDVYEGYFVIQATSVVAGFDRIFIVITQVGFPLMIMCVLVAMCWLLGLEAAGLFTPEHLAGHAPSTRWRFILRIYDCRITSVWYQQIAIRTIPGEFEGDK